MYPKRERPLVIFSARIWFVERTDNKTDAQCQMKQLRYQMIEIGGMGYILKTKKSAGKSLANKKGAMIFTS